MRQGQLPVPALIQTKSFALFLLLITGVYADDPFVGGAFHWTARGPLIDLGSGMDEADPHVAIKDPTVVFYEGRWHVIATLRKKSGKVMMEQLSFTDWEHANNAPRTVIDLHGGYSLAARFA